MNVESREIDIAKVEEVLNKIREGITFFTRVVKYGRIQVKFLSEELAAAYVTRTLEIDKWFLFPTCSGKRITRIRVGKMQFKIEVECVAAAVLFNTTDEIEILQATKHQKVGLRIRVIYANRGKRSK